MPIDPAGLATILFAGMSAVASAVQAWVAYRDKKKAAEAFDSTFARMRDSGEAKAAGLELLSVIPPDVVVQLESRADHCWTGYREVLDGPFLPNEIDRATDDVQACVCRELNRINKLNGMIPTRWQGQWARFDCAARAVARSSGVATGSGGATANRSREAGG